MKFDVAPFLQPHPAAIRHFGWELQSSAGLIPLPLEMDHWDYQTQLALTAKISLDLRKVTDDCGLDASSRFSLIAVAKSSKTPVETKVADVPVPAGQEICDVTLTAIVPGGTSGGRLSLETLLVVADAKPVTPLAPVRAGSILWRDVQHSHLQGIGTQFPTDAEDFGLTRSEVAKAGWKLSIDTSEPDALFLTSVRLTLNTRHAAVMKLLSGSKDAETRQLQRMIDFDVTRQLVNAALDAEEILSLDVDWEAVSVGGILRNLLQQLWPTGEDPQTLRSWYVNDRTRIETHLQHVRGILG
jgi:hypothetical protein